DPRSPGAPDRAPRLAHAWKRVKIVGVNDSPVGFCPSGSLMPTKKLASCRCRAVGPPVAPRASRAPAFVSTICAVQTPVSKAPLAGGWAGVGASSAGAWPRVASTAWLKRLGSRPSHMTALRKPRLVEGSGRRYMDTMPVVGLVRPVTGLVVHR